MRTKPVILPLLVLAQTVCALNITNYYSPHDRNRPKRPETRYIILHTTEGATEGSLRKIHDNGEAHYVVTPTGKIYRTISRSRIAAHAGRSMWNGRSNIDTCSIGIEVVGYHNKSISEAQYAALKELIAQLQRIYKMPDDHVLCHAMVAYGAPNRWHPKSHRGRKRCGMLFARRSVRLRLGLTRQPTSDPDVDAGRLVVADAYLMKVLYGSAREQETASARFLADDAMIISANRSAWDIARDKYGSEDTVYVFPDGRRLAGNKIRDWKKMPAGTRVMLGAGQRDNDSELIKEIGIHGSTAQEVAGDEYARATTLYLLKDGSVKRGSELTAEQLDSLPEGTQMLVGYTHGGAIEANNSAFDICGPRWNYPSTLYRMPDGRFAVGNNVNEHAIPRGTLVFFRN